MRERGRGHRLDQVSRRRGHPPRVVTRPDRYGSTAWNQDAPGIPGAVEAGDLFGGSVAAGDFNGDGRDDLAIGVPFEITSDPTLLSGMVHVLLGGSSGLTSIGSQGWTSNTPGLGGTLTGGFFGRGLHAIHLGSRAHLLIGAPAERYDGNSDSHEGSVYDLPGSPSGPTIAGHHVWRLDGSGSINGSTDLAAFGGTIA